MSLTAANHSGETLSPCKHCGSANVKIIRWWKNGPPSGPRCQCGVEAPSVEAWNRSASIHRATVREQAEKIEIALRDYPEDVGAALAEVEELLKL